LLYEVSIVGARIFGKKNFEEDNNNDKK
jgi:Sec-independent protein secretion pathway component TatC